MTRRPVAAALALVTLLALGCTDGRRTATPTPSASPSSVSVSPSATPSTAAPPVTPSATASVTPPGGRRCPTDYAAPDRDRPVVVLSFVVADSKTTLTGKETVNFTPDMPVDRLVFRLWANSPVPRRSGGSTTVTRFDVDGKETAFTLSADRTMLTAPLGRVVPAKTLVTAHLDFTLTLPSGANERLGHSGGTAWFGSGFPLLAWQRGRGWATEPATAVFAEAAASEAFQLGDMVVDTAPGDTVLASGTEYKRDGRKRHFRADAIRDVLVAVGPFRMSTLNAPGVRIRVGVTPGMSDDPARLASLHRSAITSLARFGPFPHSTLDVAVVPYLRGGVEFPGAILLGARQDRDATLVHEVAHQYFYGLVGNNQGRDPWLDEAFATYAEALARGTSSRYLGTDIPASGRNRVGAPMTYWESRASAYYRSVYVQGAAALLRARSSVGAQTWDRAMRCYVAAQAHTIATPRDVSQAFAEYPAALAILRRVGALPA